MNRPSWRADAPTWTFRAVLLVAAAVFVRVGRRQWFIRDDWAFVITRPLMHRLEGTGSWLFTGQDGHWMTVPLLIYRAIQGVFGLGSYWPFLLANLAAHVGAVLALRVLLRRHEVNPWTSTVLCSLLLLFGSGWENIVFAVQLTYNLSLVAFFCQLLLVDHDGPPDRRDAFGSLLGVVSIMSSGFGPFFLLGAGLVLVLRRRWLAAAIAVVPQGLLYAWWWMAWGSEGVGSESHKTVSGAVRYARLGMTATLHGLAGELLLGGALGVGTLAVLCWPGLAWTRRRTPAVLAVVAVVMLLGIGWERAGLGLATASASRYQYMAAMLLVPAVALAVDQVGRYHRWATVVALAVLAISTARNARLLVRSGDAWADRSHRATDLFEEVAGSPAYRDADPGWSIEAFNPDVRLQSLDVLVDQGAIVRRAPADDAARALVAQVLAGHPVDLDALARGVAVPSSTSP